MAIGRLRAVLSIERKLQRQLIRHTLAQHFHLQIVGDSADPVESLVMIAKRKPDIWIHAWEAGPDLEALLSHLQEVAPDLKIVGLPPTDSAGYLRIPIRTMDDLVATLRDQDESSQLFTR